MPAINVTFKNTEVSESLKEYFIKSLDKILPLLRDENTVHIELEFETGHKSGPFHRAGIIIMPNSEFFAEATGEDFYQAIDLLIPKIREQLLKDKDKRVSERRKEGAELKDFESEAFNAE